MKGNKKIFCRHTSSKRKTRENVGLLLNRAGALVTKSMEKAQVLKGFFTSVFTDKIGLQESLPPETRARKTYPQWRTTMLGSI